MQQNSLDLDVDWGLVVINQNKLAKKLAFFKDCEETKWKMWKKKLVPSSLPSSVQAQCVALNRKLKRKLRSQRRKFYKKQSAIVNTAHYALENNLVRNLTTVEVPLYSIAVLSYGPGWIPPPEKNINQLKVDALNTANKQSWAAIFKDSSESTTKEVPLSLLKKDVTSPAPLVKDTAVNQSRDAIRNFSANVSPQRCKHRLNKFEREGLQWLKNAVRSRKIAITQADKGGCILIVYPELIVSSTIEKLNDVSGEVQSYVSEEVQSYVSG